MTKQEEIKILSIKQIDHLIETVGKLKISHKTRKILKIFEQLTNAEFERMEVKPFIHHFVNIPPFSAITIVSFHSSRREIADYIREESKSPLSFINQASYLLENLACNRHIYGVAICDTRDAFNRQWGRVLAKLRLLKHLKVVDTENEEV
jgi:hypothetical protein